MKKVALLILATSMIQPVNANNEVAELRKMVKSLNDRINALEKAELKKPLQPASDNQLPEPKQVVKSSSDKMNVTLSGQVHRGVLYADNKEHSKFFHVENDNYNSFINLTADGKLNEDITAQAVLEIGSRYNSSADVFITKNSVVADTERNKNGVDVRKADFIATSKTIGKIYAGHGSTSTDNIAESDLSGTDNVASAAGVNNMAGGIRFIDTGRPATVTNPRTKINDVWDDMDGGRSPRIRYDTPQIGIFILSASHAESDSGDASICFDTEASGTKIIGGVGASKQHGLYRQYMGSTSVLFPVGINLTVAGGVRNQFRDGFINGDPDQVVQGRVVGRKSAKYIFGKLGYKFKVFDVGETAIAANLGANRHLAQNNDKVTTYGAVAVQNFDAIAAQTYLSTQWYDLHRPNNKFGTIFATILGVYIKF